jgi:MFS family permease
MSLFDTHITTSRFPALHYRDFRLLWMGQFLSRIGSSMQSATILWHIYRLTDSPLALGLIGLVRIVPIVVFSPLAGVVADVHDRRRLMVYTQSGLAILAAVLAWLTGHGMDTAWGIYLISALNAAVGCFDNPARQSLIPNLVPPRHLTNAVSLNVIVFQTASVVGPSLAGVLLAVRGAAIVYWINAASFLAVLFALWLMRPTPRTSGGVQKISLHAAIDGLRFIHRSPIILSTMLLDFAATFFASAMTLLPVFARDILHVGPRGYGLLSSAPSIGAVVTGGIMSLLRNVHRQGRLLFVAVGVYGLATVVFGLSPGFTMAFLSLALIGASDTISMVLRGTIRQLATPDELRGRMTSVNMMFVIGGPQLGELEAGAVAQVWGARFSVVTGGLACVMAVVLIAIRWPHLREYDSHQGEHAADAAT